MKTTISLLILIFCASCSKDAVVPEQVNPMVGTTWEAPDEISHLIWGGTCVYVLDFYSATECQKIEKRSNVVTKAEVFDYTFSGNKVTVTNKGVWELTGTVTGSLMKTTIGDSNGAVTFSKK